jgi:hypothetical protein
MLTSHQCLGLPSGLLPSGLPTKTLYTLILYIYTRATCTAHLVFLSIIIRTILDEDYRSLSPCSLLHSRYPVRLSSKHNITHSLPNFVPLKMSRNFKSNFNCNNLANDIGSVSVHPFVDLQALLPPSNLHRCSLSNTGKHNYAVRVRSANNKYGLHFTAIDRKSTSQPSITHCTTGSK